MIWWWDPVFGGTDSAWFFSQAWMHLPNTPEVFSPFPPKNSCQWEFLQLFIWYIHRVSFYLYIMVLLLLVFLVQQPKVAKKFSVSKDVSCHRLVRREKRSHNKVNVVYKWPKPKQRKKGRKRCHSLSPFLHREEKADCHATAIFAIQTRTQKGAIRTQKSLSFRMFPHYFSTKKIEEKTIRNLVFDDLLVRSSSSFQGHWANWPRERGSVRKTHPPNPKRRRKETNIVLFSQKNVVVPVRIKVK